MTDAAGGGVFPRKPQKRSLEATSARESIEFGDSELQKVEINTVEESLIRAAG